MRISINPKDPGHKVWTELSAKHGPTFRIKVTCNGKEIRAPQTVDTDIGMIIAPVWNGETGSFKFDFFAERWATEVLYGVVILNFIYPQPERNPT